MSVPRCARRCGCAECVIGEDAFTGGATTTVTGWTELEGDWSKDGIGNLTTAGPAVIRFDTPHPEDATGDHNVIVKVRGSGSGVVRARAIVAMVDVNNYLAGEVYIDDAGCDFLKLYKVSGGSAAQLGDSQAISGAAFGEDYDLQVCWRPDISSGSGSGGSGAGTLRARVSGGGLEFTYGNQAVTSSLGTYAGLGIPAGTVFFTGFLFNYMEGAIHPTCPDCNTPCPVSSDNFEDAAKTACLWDSGSASGGKFTTSGKARHLVFHPQLKGRMSASASVIDGPSVSRTVHINDDNVGSSLTAVYGTDADSRTLTIYRDGVELETQTVDDVIFPTPAVYITITACFDGRYFAASAAGLCVEAPTTEIPGGKWAALEGSATWDDFILNKTKDLSDPTDVCGTCKCPPEPRTCTDCCTESVDDVYSVDLGSSSWTTPPGLYCWPHPITFCNDPDSIAGCHSFCENVEGEYLVEGPAGPDNCLWSYSQLWECTSAIGSSYFSLAISLLLHRPSGQTPPTKCRWEVNIHVDYTVDGGPGPFTEPVCYPGSDTIDIQVTYRSEFIEEDECDEMPVMLTKVVTNEPHCPCDGVLPDVIWVRKVVV